MEMKRKGIISLGTLIGLLVLLLGPTASVYAAMPQFAPEEGVIIEEINSGDVLAEQNASEVYYPASTTKLMTALVLMDYAGDNLQEKVTVGKEIETIGYESSVAHLEEGEIYTYEQLLYALLLPSGNDAANVIATAIGRKISGSETTDYNEAIRLFVDQMNQKVTELGLEKTHFVNAHGLHDNDHYTTPKDLLKIGKAAFANETIAKVEGTKIYEMTTNNGEKQKWKNTDLLLYPNASEYGAQIVDTPEENTDEQTEETETSTDEADLLENPYYNPKATGGKTGNTDEAGRCFVFSAEDGNARVVGVILKGESKGIFEQSNQMINEVFDQYRLLDWTTGDGHYKDFILTNTHYKDGHDLAVKTEKAYSSMILKGSEDQYSANLVWDKGLIQESEGSLKLIGDIEAGQQVAELQIYKEGALEKTTAVYAENQLRKKNWIDYFRIVAVVGVPVLIVIILVIRQLQKRKRRILRERRREARRREQQRMAQTGGRPSGRPTASAQNRARNNSQSKTRRSPSGNQGQPRRKSSNAGAKGQRAATIGGASNRPVKKRRPTDSSQPVKRQKR